MMEFNDSTRQKNDSAKILGSNNTLSARCFSRSVVANFDADDDDDDDEMTLGLSDEDRLAKRMNFATSRVMAMLRLVFDWISRSMADASDSIVSIFCCNQAFSLHDDCT